MSNSLKINVLTIPEEGLNIVFSEEGKWFRECFRDGEYPGFNLRKVDAKCRITRTSSTIFVRGNISVVYGINCSRCLEEIDLAGESDFTYTLIPETTETKADVELQAEELEISYYSGDVLDITTIICEQIILQIPIKPLCSERCKGLCPRCGINLNMESCNCRSDVIDDRLAVLKNFKIKKIEED